MPAFIEPEIHCIQTPLNKNRLLRRDSAGFWSTTSTSVGHGASYQLFTAPLVGRSQIRQAAVTWPDRASRWTEYGYGQLSIQHRRKVYSSNDIRVQLTSLISIVSPLKPNANFLVLFLFLFDLLGRVLQPPEQDLSAPAQLKLMTCTC